MASSARRELHQQLLAATHNSNFPELALLTGDALEVAGPNDLGRV
jgi:hypothetical protein